MILVFRNAADFAGQDTNMSLCCLVGDYPCIAFVTSVVNSGGAVGNVEAVGRITPDSDLGEHAVVGISGCVLSK